MAKDRIVLMAPHAPNSCFWPAYRASWLTFEFYNLFIENWRYLNLP